MHEWGGAGIIKRGKKPLTHQRQKQTAHEGGVRGVEVSGMRKKMEIVLGVKINTNISFFSFLSKCRIQKRIIERLEGPLEAQWDQIADRGNRCC